MTLIEIMVVLAIIGLIVGGVAVAAFGQLGNAKIKTAMNDVTQIQSASEMYMVSKNKCPKDMKELKAGGILKKSKKDPWGTAFQITCPGEHSEIDVSSAGPDKQFGSEDDVNSWDEGDAEVGS
jgi:general secretion pathway protein G